jgi:hypothetical protein
MKSVRVSGVVFSSGASVESLLCTRRIGSILGRVVLERSDRISKTFLIFFLSNILFMPGNTRNNKTKRK